MAVDDSKWYTRARGKVLGPFSWLQLEAMRNRGQISKFHELSQDRRNWIPAGDLADLFTPSPSGRGPEIVPEGVYGLGGQAPHPQTQGTDADLPLWYHARAGTSAGPFRMQDLRSLTARGEIDATTHVWKEGMAGWVACREIAELAPLFAPASALSANQGTRTITGVPQTSGLAIASLVLGLLWLGGLGSLLAVIFGGVSLSQISRSRGLLEGRGMAVAGLILGILGLTLIGIIILGEFTEVARQDHPKPLRAF